jgi:anti-anti-sigma regulatory factor
MAITERSGRSSTTLHLRGTFDAAEAERLHQTLARSDSGETVTVDFHEVRQFHDLAVARLVSELRESGGRVIVHGLSEHHHRLMRYCGLGENQANPHER